MNFSDSDDFARRLADSGFSEDYFYWCRPPLRGSEKEEYLELALAQQELADLLIEVGAFSNRRSALKYIRAGGIPLLDRIIRELG